jgi:hypothetical protein
MEYNCPQCEKKFSENRTDRVRICCSAVCSTKWRHKNKPFSLFVKGHKVRVGMKHSEKFKESRREDKNPAWKGVNASIRSKHLWVEFNFERKGICEHCLEPKKTDWSNRYHTYTRKREDWQELCRSCHQKYDYKKGLRKSSQRVTHIQALDGY